MQPISFNVSLHVSWDWDDQERKVYLREWVEMVRPEGVEPPTYWFVASCSIQLSYGRTLHLLQPS